ncbi:MAG: putative sulfate/molybdate transporter [Chloroflexota bacterium]|nr:putative sulfate/molybdate transporter [Chloroflexota bacterium]
MSDVGAGTASSDLAPGAAGGRRVPRGVHLASESRGLPIPDVKVRCLEQAPDAVPLFARRRFAWNISELSGALGDLGTFLPHIVAAITVVGMAPSGVLTMFGLFYLTTGAFFGVPMGVQPMKAASAAVLIQHLEPGEIAAAGIVIGAFFLLLGATGVITRLAALVPPVLTAGIQLGLGLALAALGVKLIGEQLWLGVVVAALMLVLLNSSRFPAALVGIAAGVVLARVTGTGEPLPALQLGLHAPGFIWPTWPQMASGVELAVLPQVPLTLTNAIIVTAAVTRQLFPKEVHPVNERNLAITTGLGNLLAAPFGGYLMCHGAGGITGHYRFGARTAAAPAIIGLAFLSLGVLLGDSAMGLLKLIPQAAVGGLLFFSGIELAVSSKPQSYAGSDLFAVLLIGAISVASNAAIAFAVGLPLAYAIRRGLVRL